MKEKFKEHIGKYCLDVSKMIVGGVVIAAIMKENISLVWLLLAGTFAAVATAATGFFFLSLTTKSNK